MRAMYQRSGIKCVHHFREGDRIQVSIIGSWWAGLLKAPEIHMRTVFEDYEHGSDMQISTLILNLHEKVMMENEFLKSG